MSPNYVKAASFGHRKSRRAHKPDARGINPPQLLFDNTFVGETTRKSERAIENVKVT